VLPLKEILGLRRCGGRNTLRAAAPHVAPGVRMQMTFARVNRLLRSLRLFSSAEA